MWVRRPSISTPSTPETFSRSSSPSGPTRYEASACPVADQAFCATATKVIAALQRGDADRLFGLSRRDRLVCADLATQYFPGVE